MRRSQYAKNRTRTFDPPIDEWRKACEIYPYAKQIYRHFDIVAETFYRFLDREHYKEEQDSGYKSPYLEAYITLRQQTRIRVVRNLLEGSDKKEPAMTIFAAKAFAGIMDVKDREHLRLKREELRLKTQGYLSDLANKFNLSYEELSEFTSKHIQYRPGTGEDRD